MRFGGQEECNKEICGLMGWEGLMQGEAIDF